jgi:Fe-S-cluster containining protein
MLDADLIPLGQHQFARALLCAREILAQQLSPLGKFAGICQTRYAALDVFCEHARERPDIACSAGCSSCCHQRVPISGSEAFFIALYLNVVKPRHGDLDRVAKQVSHLAPMQRWAREIACPFLVDRHCSIYSVRPGACRTHFSLSLNACKAAWKTRKSRQTVTIPFLGDPKLVGQMMISGSDYAMREAGWQFAVGDLEPMVQQAIQPDALEAWLQGAPVFTETPQSVELNGRLDELYQIVSDNGSLAAEGADLAPYALNSQNSLLSHAQAQAERENERDKAVE